MAECIEPQVTDDWFKCYGESWKGALLDPSFSHPAKASRALARRIYDHAIEEGWLKAGDQVLDPFAGIGGFALDAMRLGMNYVGLELEPKFVRLGVQNIQHWDRQFKGVIPNWGSAWIYQGDSRYLVALLSRANIPGGQSCVTSPPYSALGVKTGKVDNESWSDGRPRQVGVSQRESEGYGGQPGQLGELPEGDIEVTISSPPYAASQAAANSTGIDVRKQWETYRDQGGGMGYEAFVEQQKRHSFEYGETDGRLQCLPVGDVDAVVSSSPYSESLSQGNKAEGYDYTRYGGGGQLASSQRYGIEEGQLGDLPEGNFDVMISSPPFGAGETRDRTPVQDGEVASAMTRAYTQDRQGVVDGNLAHLDDGEGFEVAVSSPPYETGCRHTGGKDPHPEHIEGGDYHGLGIEVAVSSPPFVSSVGSDDPDKRDGLYRDPKRREDVSLTGTYGETPGQLGKMEGEFQAAVGSPPFEGVEPTQDDDFRYDGKPLGSTGSHYGSSHGQLASLSGGIEATRSSPPFEGSMVESGDPNYAHKFHGDQAEYGQSCGQLGGMEGDFEGSVTSPPYLPRSDRRIPAGGDHEALQRRDIETGHAPISTFRTSYSDNPDNLGNPTGANQETFWGAARVIVEQVYQLLAPGGVAIWVCKDFIRKKALVPFTHQWAQLCVSVGFEWLHEHKCWMVEDNGTQLGLFGEESNKDMIKKRMSFFRRLHVKKYPHLAIEHESVLCLRKPMDRR